MASYRPKSLNELNNLYDKSKEAQNAIKKQSSAITDADATSKADVNKADLYPEVPAVSASQIASQELSDAVNQFIKTFGENDPAQEKAAVRPQAPMPKVVKTTVQRPKSEGKAEQPSTTQAPPVSRKAPEPRPAAKEKPILISNAEKSELIAEYMRIMNDEDDDSSSIKSKFKSKKKPKKDKHSGSPVFDEKPKEEEAPLEIPQQQSAVYDENDYQEPVAPPAQEAEAELFDSFANEDADLSFEADAAQDDVAEEEAIPEESTKKKDKKKVKKEKKEKKEKKGKLVQVFVMLLLLTVLTCAVGTSLMKVVVGIDSGKPFADKYYFFTADSTRTYAGITDGDLVITEEKQVSENEAFAYDEDGTVKFALKGTQISDSVLMAHSDGEVKMIPTSQLKGAVVKTVPKLGSVLSFTLDNFLIIIAILVTIALALILVLAFAFRGKPAVYEADDEDSEDDIQHEDELSDIGYETGEEETPELSPDEDEQYEDYYNEESSFEYDDSQYYDETDSAEPEDAASYEDENEDSDEKQSGKHFNSDDLFSSID